MNGPARIVLADDDEFIVGTIRSYKVGVCVKTDPLNLAFNGLRFADHGDAVFYGGTLRARWLDVIRFAVVESNDPPNCTLPIPSDRYPVKRT